MVVGDLPIVHVIMHSTDIEIVYPNGFALGMIQIEYLGEESRMIDIISGSASHEHMLAEITLYNSKIYSN